jgi:hypothetical protein
LGFKIECWPHDFNSHVEYGIRLLKPPQDTSNIPGAGLLEL